MSKILSYIQNYHCQILWITLGLLFILDIITTTIGLQKGGYEQTHFMIPFVNDPNQHFLIKLIAFCIIYIPIDLFLKHLHKKIMDETSQLNKACYAITYSIIIVVLIWYILLLLSINIGNITFIISKIDI